MGASESLKQFLRQKKERDESAGVDWEARKQERLQAISELYKNIEAWLAPSIGEGIVAVSREPCELSDRHLGEYSADALILRVGNSQIEFRPEERLVVGASARVDMRSGGRMQTMAHFPGQGWKFIVRGPGVQTLPVNEDSFSDFLKQLLEE